jgi:serine phosphatase RsbU (regulator of sigma subunit)
LPLGLFSHVTHDAPTVALEFCACLLLVSRGLTEARYEGGEFGLDRVSEILGKASVSTAEQICDEVLNRAAPDRRRRSSLNDLTALALLRKRAQTAHA